MTDSYFTIEKASEGLFKDKGSKFLAYAFPVKSEVEIKEHIHRLKKEHYSARHHCFAWQLGTDKKHFRVNDDGEPSSTAGRPILAQIQRRNLTYVLVVVVRYFGGKLLGVSGLIKAYGEAAADALDRTVIVERQVEVFLSVEFDYLQMNDVMKVFKENDLLQSSSEFGLVCNISTAIRKSMVDHVYALLNAIEGTKIIVND